MNMFIIFFIFLGFLGLIIIIGEIKSDNDDDKEHGRTPRSVAEKPAGGVIIFGCFNLLTLTSLITGIDFIKEYSMFILIPTFVIGFKLSKNYDKDNNHDKQFYFILVLLFCILMGLVFLKEGKLF